MSREIPAELVGGPYDSRTGMLTIGDTPQQRLSFSLDDDDHKAGLIVPGRTSVGTDLIAWYDLIDEKPRKITMIEDVDGHPRARSELGVRYRYTKDSPCERLFAQADQDALLTSAAHDAVMSTRKLLLDAAAERKRT